MHGEPGSTYHYAPDGLVGEALDELIDRAYAETARAPLPTSALLNGSATEQRRRRIDRRALAAVIRPYGDGGMKPTGRYDPRPGGSNRQERARRVGAPESLIEAIEEIGMLQLHACVIVWCDQCGDSPGHEAHYPTEDVALDTAAAEGWRTGPGGRLWCSACATVLTCDAEGHEFSAWRHPVTSDGQLAPSEYRHCRRCCLIDSRPARWLIGSTPGQGKSAGFSALPTGAGTTVAEVA